MKNDSAACSTSMPEAVGRARARVRGEFQERRLFPVDHVVGERARREDALRQRRHGAGEPRRGGVDHDVEPRVPQRVVARSHANAPVPRRSQAARNARPARAPSPACGWRRSIARAARAAAARIDAVARAARAHQEHAPAAHRRSPRLSLRSRTRPMPSVLSPTIFVASVNSSVLTALAACACPMRSSRETPRFVLERQRDVEPPAALVAEPRRGRLETVERRADPAVGDVLRRSRARTRRVSSGERLCSTGLPMTAYLSVMTLRVRVSGCKFRVDAYPGMRAPALEPAN